MGFFFKNKKKNKEEETVTPVVETTPEVPAKEGMILVREGIKLGLPTVSMEEAIVAAGELLRDLGYVDDDYIPAMIRRNEEASVYMGLGLAIPHGTEDAKRDVKRSGIIVMQYPDGVEFNGGTAQLVIGIAGVGDEHLEILGQITEAVTEEEILEELNIKENHERECKLAAGGLPESIWETYSSFANTNGGTILLGIREYRDSFTVEGRTDKQIVKYQKDFWSTLNDRNKVSKNILLNHHVRPVIVREKKILRIDVPAADRHDKPVYIGTDPMKGTYKRDYEGDGFR